MKKGLKFLIVAVLFCTVNNVRAQFDSSLNAELRRLLIGLNRADCSAPFLFDLAAHFTNDTFYRVKSYDTSNSRNWFNLYFELNAMSYSNGYLPSDTLLEDKVNNIYNYYNISSPTSVETGKVPLGLMDFDYNSIIPEAFDTINFGRWYFWNNDSIWDNPSRTTEPFELNTENTARGTCKEIFSFSPLISGNYYRNVTFTVDPGNFFFYDNPLYSTNILSHPSPHKFFIDFDDGVGWRVVDPFNYSEIPVIYQTKGIFYPKAKVEIDGVIIKYSVSTFTIATGMIERLPDLNYDLSNINIGVYKGCNSNNLLKPIIYVSGIDILEDRRIPDIYSDMIINADKPELLPILKNYDYDFVIIDWKDSKADMRVNASALVNAINYLKTQSDSTHEFVVIGESMGGVIARYALTYMETSSYFSSGSTIENNRIKKWRSHNTRLFISLDAPHQGAIVPLAFQHANDWIYKVPRPLIRTCAFFYSAFKKSKDIERNFLNRDAVKQLLILHRDTRNGSSEYTCHAMRTDFMNDLDALNPTTHGWPEHCKLVALSNGLMDGSFQVGYKDSIMHANDILMNANMFVGVKIFKVISVPLFAMDDSKLRINPLGSGNIVEMGWRFNIGTTIVSVSSFPYGLIWSLRGCLVNLFRKKTSPCNVLGVGFPFTVDINNAEPWERFPGGTEYGLDRTSEKKDRNYKTWLTSTIINYDRFNGYYEIKNEVGPRFLLNSNFTLKITSEVPRFCFIPLQSALDYHGVDIFGADLPQFHNISINSVSVNMSRTPFDVIIGWNRSGSYPKTIYFSPNAKGFRSCNATHLSLRNDTIDQYDGFEPAVHGILNREIGDRVMYLDNMNINREGIYQASDSIVAGRHESRFYQYPDRTPASFGLTIESLNSDSGMFIVDSFTTQGQVEFRAGDQINLMPGFEARFNSKFFAHIIEMNLCEYTLEEIDDMVYNPIPIQQNSISEIEISERRFSVFPNPTFSLVNIRTSNAKIDNGLIMDIHGKQISYGESNGNNYQFNLEKLAPGVYICIVECEGKEYRFKVIKQ